MKLFLIIMLIANIIALLLGLGVVGCVIFSFIALVIYLLIDADTCPKCKKRFSMIEISRDLRYSQDITMDVEQEIKNNKGEITGKYNQAVPATLYVYDCIYKCKYCGFQKEVVEEKKERK